MTTEEQQHARPESQGGAHEVLDQIDRRLEAGRSQGDAERLETLEDIRRTLENELERDPDQAGSPRS